MLFAYRNFIILLYIVLSSILENEDNKLIGLSLFSKQGSPVIRIGITLAHFSSVGNIPVSNVRFMICVTGSRILQ